MGDYRSERETIRWFIDENFYKFLTTVNACVAGGFITSVFSGLPVEDIDIFFRSEEDYEKTKRYLNSCESNKYRGTRSICETDRAQTYAMSHNKNFCPTTSSYGLSYFRRSEDNKETPFQIVKTTVNKGEPEEIINNFDLTVCQGAFDFKSEKFIFGDRFFVDISKREVRVNASCKNIIGCFFRLHKYMKKGFSVPPSEYMKVSFMMNGKRYLTFSDIVDDLQLSFNNSVVHHLYNKIRYPNGVRCEVKDSLLNNAFDPSFIVEWIEEYNVAGPHYPVKEGVDEREESLGRNTSYDNTYPPEYDSKGNLKTILSLPKIIDTSF
jgi:hypothetical protein